MKSSTIKIFVSISLIALSTTLASIVGAGIIVYQRDSQAKKESANTSDKFGALTTSGNKLSETQVATHNKSSDCWEIINSKVYSLTPFLASHPGGSFTITPYCGKDATNAFNTKDKNPASKHSQNAVNMLKDYFVGDIGQPVSEITISTPSSKSRFTLSKPTTPVVKNSVPTTNNNQSSLTTSVVATHNTSSNCWIIISNNVYDVTSYLTSHPGGVGIITQYCGSDATNAFNTKDRNPGSSHSQYAQQLLNNYFVGSLGSNVQNTPVISQNTTPPTTQTTTTTTNTNNSNTTTSSTAGYSTADVASHNTSANCWIIISNKIYNVTNYLTSHPGGVGAITPYCGKESTNAFSTKGGGRGNHSNNAYSLLNSYLIGSLNSGSTSNTGTTTTTTTTTQNNSTNTTPQTTLPSSVSAKYPGATIQSQNVEDNGSQELTIIYNGQCRHVSVSSSGSIKEDSKC